MSWLRRAAVTDAFAQAAGAPALALRELRVTMGGRVLIERLSMSAAGSSTTLKNIDRTRYPASHSLSPAALA
ncbi:ABC transporter ATP-binding protein, partial [Ralstonia pseudosolanacearum]